MRLDYYKPINSNLHLWNTPSNSGKIHFFQAHMEQSQRQKTLKAIKTVSNLKK